MFKQPAYLFSVIFALSLVSSVSADYFLGDDFESYSSTVDLRNTWSPTGATETWYFLDVTFVHMGSRSLRIWYDNSFAPYYCGVSRTFDTPVDWTLIGTAEGLSLWFRGSPNADQIYVKLKDSNNKEALVKYTDFWDPADLVLEQWQRWKIDFGYFTDNNSDFDLTAVEMLEIGIGEPVGASPGTPGGGQVYFDDIELYQRKCNFSAGQPEADINKDCVIDWADVNAMADEWLDDDYDFESDTDRDGEINFKDYAILADSWLDTGSTISECVHWRIFHPDWLFCDVIGWDDVASFSARWLSGGCDTADNWCAGADRDHSGDVDFIDFALLAKDWLKQFELPAFPGAEGWGATTPGGRGGRFIKVTNLNTAGPGSLAEACSAPGPRIVVFEVSGVINGDVRITQPYITIAGQTAPGAGITIEGMLGSYNYGVHDVIVRHLRMRRQRAYDESGDCIQMGGLGLEGTGTYNLILDHLSLSWGNDEEIDFYHTHDATVQWCTVEETDDKGHPLGPHNKGFINAASDSGAISLHHNLWAHHYNRVPCMAPYRANAACDFRNNLIYNVYGGLTHDGHQDYIQSPLNNFNNYWRRGPNSIDRIYPFANFDIVDYYIEDNYFEGWGLQDHPAFWSWSTAPSWVQFNQNGGVLASPADVPFVTTQTALKTYDLVLAGAGCWPRDRVTNRTIAEVRDGTGQWGRNAPLEPTDEWFMDGLTPDTLPTDTDDDGMPDTWELAHSLNPANPDDADYIVPIGASENDRHRGYTYIEFYINELADNLLPE